METRRRKTTDVQEFARRMILSGEFQPTLKRRILAGQINRDFARTLLRYARSPRGWPEESAWLTEAPALQTLERIAGPDPSDEKKGEA
jgi:hypothetical protein